MRWTTKPLFIMALVSSVGACATFQSKHDLREPRPVRAALYLDRLYLEKNAQAHKSTYTYGVPALLLNAFDQVVPVTDLHQVEALQADLVIYARIDQGYSSTSFHINVACELEVVGLDGTSLFTGRHKDSAWNWNNTSEDHVDALGEAMGPVIRDLQQSSRVAAYLDGKRPPLAEAYRTPAEVLEALAAKPAIRPAEAQPATTEPGPSAAKGSAPIVAVFDLEKKGIQLGPGELDRLTDLLTNQLAASGVFRLIPRNQIKKRLSEQKGESYRLCYDETCQVEIGRELAANKSLSTRILKLGKSCVLTLNLYDLPTATLEQATSVEGGCSEEALASMVRRASTQLSSGGNKFSKKKPAFSPSRPAPRPSKPPEGPIHLQVQNAPEDSRVVLFSGRVTRMPPLFVPKAVRFPEASCREQNCRFGNLRRDLYLVVASGPGLRVQSDWIDLIRNESAKLNLSEQGDREEGDADAGKILVDGTPVDSKVVLLTKNQVQRLYKDNIPQDACMQLPCELTPLDTGLYWIVVTSLGHRSASYPIELSGKREHKLLVKLEKN